jgi:flagellar L-ring protein precursor FlgH
MISAHRILRATACALSLGLVLGAGFSGRAADLYARGNWPALASDRLAERVGDSLTVVVYENSQASNSADSATERDRSLSGQIAGGGSSNLSGQIGLTGSSNGSRKTDRVGSMVAQISVIVDSVLPDGDLHVTGEQVMNINGERTNIRIRGRVRTADIAAGNTVLSTRLADAEIDYDGTGYFNRSAKAGLVTRIMNWLGLS